MNKLKYSSSALIAGKLIDDTRALSSYNDKVLQKVKSFYMKRKIDEYEYGHLVNILTCLSLEINNMREKLNTLIDINERV